MKAVPMLPTSAVWPWMGMLVLWTVAFSLACRISPTPFLPKATGDRSAFGQVLGVSRVGIGHSFMDMADTYFHLGVESVKKKAFTNGLQRLAEQIRPEAHRHPRGDGIQEIMPWLRWATEMDPHNMEAYLNASFWLAGQGGRPDLAEEIMREAQRNNPRDYRVYGEKGRLFLLAGRMEDALAALDTGARLWPSPEDGHDVQDKLELGRMLSLQAFIHEMRGQREAALQLFRRSAALFPDNAAVAQRIRRLERGENTQAWARDAWKNLFPTRTICEREEHAHKDHHD